MAHRLVVVDDEPVILNLLSSLFDDDEGFELVCCENGEAAMKAMAGGVDVLLTDKNLPDVSGLELARVAREKGAEVLIITGYASLDTAIEAIHLDVFDYIIKPPRDIFEVRRKVCQAAEKHRLQCENIELLQHLQERNGELEDALRELKELQAELIQAEKLAGIGTLAAGVAHEVSSPLYGVMGLAEAIQDEPDAQLICGYAKEIVEYSQQIKEIVVQLQGYARAASSDDSQIVDLKEIIEDAILLVTRTTQFDPRCIEFVAEKELFIRAKANEIQQIFVNLIKNAAEALMEHYEPPFDGNDFQGRVRVRAQKIEGDQIQVTVEDNGPGIAPDKIPLVFDPFFTTKPPGHGTGLGLNIVYRIITKYRGVVKVQSEPGQQTIFSCQFPKAEERRPAVFG